MLAEKLNPAPARASAGESRFVLEDVPWWAYVALRDALDHRAGLKMTYLEGTLELMSPSDAHEEAKKVIARLVETWAVEKNVDLRGFGSTTFRREAKKRGLEPDECYILGPLPEDGVPDIAIEVIVSNPLVDKMAVYAGLGVREVWARHVEAGTLQIHHLMGDQYEPVARSQVVPELDIGQLSSLVKLGGNQTALVRAYQAALRG